MKYVADLVTRFSHYLDTTAGAGDRLKSDHFISEFIKVWLMSRASLAQFDAGSLPHYKHLLTAYAHAMKQDVTKVTRRDMKRMVQLMASIIQGPLVPHPPIPLRPQVSVYFAREQGDMFCVTHALLGRYTVLTEDVVHDMDKDINISVWR